MAHFITNPKNIENTMNIEQYNNSIQCLINKISNEIQKGLKITSIVPIPRGGYYPAIEISQALGIPISTQVTNPLDLVVDDLCDSGATLSKYSNNKTAVVFYKERTSTKPTFYGEKIGNNEWIEFPDEHGTTIEENIRRILQYIGEDPNREGLKDTPDRIVRMCKEIFRGYDMSQKPKITTFRNGVDGIVYDNMVVDKGDYYSLCEHHMRTFFGEYYFAYIPHPKGKILGISKIGRVVDFCASKLQIQERLVYEVIQMLTEALKDKYPPLGMALVMKGRHMCKESRGARKKGVMTSSCLTGVFKTEPALRAEFLAMCE